MRAIRAALFTLAVSCLAAAAQGAERIEPGEVLRRLAAAARRGDLKECLAYTTGPTAILVELYHSEAPEVLKRQAGVGYEQEGTRIGTGPDAGKAWARVKIGKTETVEVLFVLDPKADRWQLHSAPATPEKLADAGKNRNVRALHAIGVALNLYAAETGKYPPSLQELLKGYLKDAEAMKWFDHTTGEKVPFLYCPGLTPGKGDPNSVILVAQPRSIEKKRLTLLTGGGVSECSDKRFDERTAAQGWKPVP